MRNITKYTNVTYIYIHIYILYYWDCYNNKWKFHAILGNIIYYLVVVFHCKCKYFLTCQILNHCSNIQRVWLEINMKFKWNDKSVWKEHDTIPHDLQTPIVRELTLCNSHCQVSHPSIFNIRQKQCEYLPYYVCTWLK